MSVWEDFISTMQIENELLEQLIALGAAKQQKINDAKEIVRFANDEQTLLSRLEDVDQERALLFDVLGAGRTLEEWLSTLEQDRLEDIAPLVLALTQNLGTLQSLNHLNQELLNQSLGFIQFSLNLLQGGDNSPTYTRPGGSPAAKSIFDRKV